MKFIIFICFYILIIISICCAPESKLKDNETIEKVNDGSSFNNKCSYDQFSPEYCNGKDDNCDGKIDEHCVPVSSWRFDSILNVFDPDVDMIERLFSHVSVTPSANNAAYQFSTKSISIVNLLKNKKHRLVRKERRLFIRSVIHPDAKSIFVIETVDSPSEKMRVFSLNQYRVDDSYHMRRFQLTSPHSPCEFDYLPCYNRNIKWKMDVSKDGRWLAAFYMRESRDGLYINYLLDVWDTSDGKIVFRKSVQSKETNWKIGTVRFSEYGRSVAISRNPGYLHVFDVKTGNTLFEYQMPKGPHSRPKNEKISYVPADVVFHPKQQSIVATSISIGCRVYFFDYKKKVKVKEFPIFGLSWPISDVKDDCGNHSHLSLSFSPKGEWFTLSISNRTHFWYGVNQIPKGVLVSTPEESLSFYIGSASWSYVGGVFKLFFITSVGFYRGSIDP